MRYTHTEKPNIVLRLAALLLCLTLFSLYLLAGLYARYTVTGTAADSARVAAFQPTATITPVEQTVEYVYGKANNYIYTATFEIKVTNPSEVAVQCQLDIKVDSWLVTWYGSTGSGFEMFTLNTLGGLEADKITFSCDSLGKLTPSCPLGTLDAHDTVGTTWVFKINLPQSTYNGFFGLDDWDDGKLDMTNYFNASVTFTQVD